MHVTSYWALPRESGNNANDRAVSEYPVILPPPVERLAASTECAGVPERESGMWAGGPVQI